MLQLDEVSLFRNGRMVAQGLSLCVHAGQAALIQGPNGSGKTTLLRTVCGWRPSHAGTILWRGTPLRSALAALREDLAYLGHQDGLHDDLSARENLRWLMALGGEAPREPELDESLDRMGMLHAAWQPVRTLSRGQRRRVALARFLLTRKPLWVLDEPLAALDAEGQQRMQACVARHLQAGGVALLSCHTASWPDHPSWHRLSLPTRPGLTH